MAHFFGSVQGSRGEASRLAGKDAGMRTTAASWNGAVRTFLYVSDGQDCARITIGEWQGRGPSERVIFDGPINPKA